MSRSKRLLGDLFYLLGSEISTLAIGTPTSVPKCQCSSPVNENGEVILYVAGQIPVLNLFEDPDWAKKAINGCKSVCSVFQPPGVCDGAPCINSHCKDDCVKWTGSFYSECRRESLKDHCECFCTGSGGPDGSQAMDIVSSSDDC